MVVDMEQFPTMPAFPGCLLAEENGSSHLKGMLVMMRKRKIWSDLFSLYFLLFYFLVCFVILF